MCKKILSIVLCLIMVFSMSSMIVSAETIYKEDSFSVTGFSANEKLCVKSFERNGVYYLFMPANSDFSSLVVNFDGAMSVNGKKLQSGEITDAIPSTGLYTISINGVLHSLNVLKSENIPSVYISTESGSLDYIHASKENKESGNITVVENGVTTLESAVKQIKGRGNATWNEVKKPYNIKFDKATSLLGMSKAKKWSFLANYLDDSLIRNSLALNMGDIYGLEYTSERRAVDLYINDEYLGNYLAVESVEVGSTRVNITDLDKANEKANPDFDFDTAIQGGTGENNTPEWGGVKGSRKWMNIPNNPADITGGYLLELDMTYRYDGELCGFCTNRGQTVVFKSPEVATKDEVNYIADLFQEAEDALCSSTGYNDKNKHYSEYFDVESLAKLYIIEEFAMEADVGLSSIYFYKPSGEEKIYAGPVWDFDHAFSNPIDNDRWGISLKNTNAWFANQTTTLYYAYIIPTVFKSAYMHEDFRDVVSDIWDKTSEEFTNTYSNTIKDMGAVVSASAVMDEFRWNKNAVAFTAESKLDAYNKEVNTLANSFAARSIALNKGFAKDSAMLYYEANGGEGYAVNQNIATIGEKITVTDSQFISKYGYEFAGWNTKADGTGDLYIKGQKIQLNDRTTTLYAQWINVNPDDSGSQDENPKSGWQLFWERIADFFRRIGDFFRNLFK